jgi:small ligand-binding sensory domain FIST
MTMNVASALRKGRKAIPELAALAVAEAMAKAGLEVAQSVLLYLTSDFAHDPEPAILAAARAANCMQVTGCTTLGVFTEEDWILDAPAAAVMVFGGEACAVPALESPEAWRLTLAAPSAIETAWLHEPARRFGGVSGDATGKGPYKVWHGSRLVAAGRTELAFPAEGLRVGASRGIFALSPPAPARLEGHEILSIDNLPALAHLARHLPEDLADDAVFPLHLLMAGITWGDPASAFADNRYYLFPLLAIDIATRRVTLAKELDGEVHLFWAMRQPDAAERDMGVLLDRLEVAGAPPHFGLCFPCIGRGPYFYGGVDRDTALITRRYPGMPLLGFYGNGEIVHASGHNQLLQYSTVLALYHDHV